MSDFNMSKKALLIKNIGVLQTPIGSFAHKGEMQKENVKLHNASILSVDGKICEITEDNSLPDTKDYELTVIDASGKLVTPGLVDSHTHLVFGGWRQHEIPLKLSGMSYIDILKSGGGILSTVKNTREASGEELYNKGMRFLDNMASLGVTSCEIKSGYGLNLEDEVKQLEVIEKLRRNHFMTIVPTFLGAHATPPEYAGNPDGYLDFVCDEVIPYISQNGLAEYCDIFCEMSVFDVEESRKLLQCAKDYGMKLKIHTDEIEAIGGAELAAEIGATSAEHLIASTESGRKALSKSNTIAVLLPQTSFYLGKDYAKAQEMIALGIPVAIASDFNPGSCPSYDLQLAMTLGYLKYRMFPEEILTAVTINAACAIDRQDQLGTLEVGKRSDFVIWNADDLEMLCYRFGENLADVVVVGGEVVKGNIKE